MENGKKSPRLSPTLSSFYIFLLKCFILFFLLFIIQTADPWFGRTVKGKSPSTPHSGETGGNLRGVTVLAKGDPCLQWNIGGDYNKASRGVGRIFRAQRATPSVPERDIAKHQRLKFRAALAASQISGLVLLRSDNASTFEARAHFCWWSEEQTASNGLHYGCFSFSFLSSISPVASCELRMLARE